MDSDVISGLENIGTARSISVPSFMASLAVFAQFTHFLPLDDAVVSRAAFVIVSDDRTDGQAETLLEASK